MIGMTNVVRRKQQPFDGLTITPFHSGESINVVYNTVGYNAGEEPSLYYSYDNVTWNSWSTYQPIQSSNLIYIKGNNPNGLSKSENTYTYFEFGANVNISGNINSLLDNGDGSTVTTIPNNYCFFRLFSYNYNLISASGLLLPSTTLTSHCYRQMFSECSWLESPPSSIPATSFAAYSCEGMFDGCYSLTSVPSFTISSITGGHTFENMFSMCESITDITNIQFSATNLSNGEYCYARMFKQCRLLTNIPSSLPATTLANYCYYNMFYGCTSLISLAASFLPATTLANYCYSYMFFGCESLTTAMTTLPATARAEGCYEYMFSECFELLNAPTMFFTGTTGSTNSCEGMFEFSNKLRVIYLYSYTGSLGASNGFSNWVNGVSSSGNFMWGGMDSTRGADYIPSGWRIIPR